MQTNFFFKNLFATRLFSPSSQHRLLRIKMKFVCTLLSAAIVVGRVSAAATLSTPIGTQQERDYFCKTGWRGTTFLYKKERARLRSLIHPLRSVSCCFATPRCNILDIHVKVYCIYRYLHLIIPCYKSPSPHTPPFLAFTTTRTTNTCQYLVNRTPE